MSPPLTILFTAGGRRVALVRAFRAALDKLKLDSRILTADADPDLCSAGREADDRFGLPRCTETGYLDALLALCEREGVDMLIPLIDPDLPIIAEAQSALLGIGTTAVVSDPETVSLATSKTRTAHFLASIGIATPRVLDVGDVRRGQVEFPIFLKPDNGSASIGSRRVDDLVELEFWLPRTPSAVLFEYLAGREFTVDVYAGLSGEVTCVVPRERLQVRAGEMSKGITVEVPEIIEDSRRIVTSLSGPRGVLTLQCKLSESGRPTFFEINARFGGGVPLSIAAGADFPSWLLAEFTGDPFPSSSMRFTSGTLMLRYDAAFFVDVDDQGDTAQGTAQ